MSQENAALGRRWFEQVWNSQNIDAADQLAAADCTVHGHAPNDAVIGMPEFKEFARSVQSAFPDLRIAVEETVSEDDRVVLRWRSEGTQTGPFLGIAPTGQKVLVRGISIMRFADGKVVEGWDNWDQLGLLTQLGAVPSVELAKAS
jgi:steroid delta-isomerase-like uncharacterized protein